MAARRSLSLFGSAALAVTKVRPSISVATAAFEAAKSRTNVFCSPAFRSYATKGDRELNEFLQQEIVEEKKGMAPNLPTTLGEFDIVPEKAFLTFKRKFNDEIITVSLDVNHSVDAEAPGTMDANAENMELKSKPSFEVDIKKAGKTLSFTCSFMGAEEAQQDQQHDTVQDYFGINEVTMFEGEEITPKDYCVSGDIIDENLYDLFMNYLEERGVSDEFVAQMSDFCSDYEHSLYVGLLQKVQDFVKK